MAQPQPQQRVYSPLQPAPSPSPGQQQGAYAAPGARPAGTPPVPGSPYPQSPFVASPTTAATPTFSAQSPPAHSPPVGGGSGSYGGTPYTNGNATPTLNIADGRASATPPLNTPQSATASFQYPAASLPSATGSPAPLNVMGPPQRPADRPSRDAEYDVNDSLAGTGIDIRAEEQYMSELYATSLENTAEARTGFPVRSAGDQSSFYGAGLANQAGDQTYGKSQDEVAMHLAERAWQESSMKLAQQRTQEIADPFLFVALIHHRAERIAKEHHLELNLENRGGQAGMGKMRGPEYFATPTVTVRMEENVDGSMTKTSGSWIPQDAYLVDQLALLSIATKHRLRELIEDANIVTKTRQQTAHGVIPAEWKDAAGAYNAEPLEEMNAADAVDGTSDSLKRSADEMNGVTYPKPVKLQKIGCVMTQTMRDLAKQEREWEEARLRRRKRKGAAADGAPATPTSAGAAPDGEKSMTKREMNKMIAAKAAEASSHANQNITSSMFAGLGRSNLFGKKKAKSYDWMNKGGNGNGSGANTPAKASLGPVDMPSTPTALTADGRNRLGTWREDRSQGQRIQMRDWVTVLEADGREPMTLQHAYLRLEEDGIQ